MTTQEIHEISGRILTLESKCEQYNHYIEQILRDNKNLTESGLIICVNSKRSQTRIELSPEEVIIILQKRLKNYESELSELKKRRLF
jgi:prefoldin subunit 5